jgi:Zn-dependent M28 family amino/carboxypeptidase
VETGITVSASVESAVRTVETKNVVGLIRGTERSEEWITVSSHYDHFGVGEAIDGDSIYNGAYDNASGTALLLTLASTVANMAQAPGRSILFIATAAEEQGLLGAEWYAQSPLHPLNRTVAEINVDGANLWGETDDVIVHGEERSALGVYVRPRASMLGLTIIPDAEPEKGFFFRSDHFPFAKAGCRPSTSSTAGSTGAGPRGGAHKSRPSTQPPVTTRRPTNSARNSSSTVRCSRGPSCSRCYSISPETIPGPSGTTARSSRRPETK